MTPVNKTRKLSHNFSFELLVKLIFAFGIVLLPLISWKVEWSIRYEIPKVFFFNRWVELLALFVVASQIFRYKKKNLDSKLLLLIFIYVIIATVASIQGSDLVKSLLGNYYRGQGLFTLLHLASLAIIISLTWNKSWEKLLAYSFVTSSLIVSIQTIILGISYHALDNISASVWQGPISSNFGQPNFLAGYIVVTLSFAIYLLISTKDRNQKLLFIAIIVIQLIAIVLTKSKAGLFGSALVITGGLILTSGHKMRKVLVVIGILILGVGFTALVNQNRFLDKRLIYMSDRIGSRERIVIKGMLALKEKPILGWGWSNFDHAFDSVDWPMKYVQDVYVDKAHSNILEVVVTTGVVGLLLYLGIIVRTGYVLTKSKSSFHKVLLLTLIIFVIHSQTNIISIAEEMIFWIIVGVSISIAPKLLRR